MRLCRILGIILPTILFICFPTKNAFAVTTWEKTFGGDSRDEGRSVQQTTDGGYIIAGGTRSYYPTASDVYLIKTDGSGNQLWQKAFGGNSYSTGRSVQQTTDSGYIIAGNRTTPYGAKIYLIKTDGRGNQLWQKTFGGDSVGYSVQQTTDGGYIIVGYTGDLLAGSADVYLVKTNGSGNQLWQKTFGGDSNDVGYSVQQTFAGGYIIAGVTRSFGAGDYDVYLVKTDGSGNKLWQKTFGGDSRDEGRSVQETADGGYIIAGGTRSFSAGDYDVYLVKTDGSGKQLWHKTFGGSSYDGGSSVQQTAEGGYIIAGGTYSFGAGHQDVYLVKTDGSGKQLWHKTFGGSSYDGGSSVQQTAEGGYIIAGATRSFGAGDEDVYLIYYKEREAPKPRNLRITH